MIYKNTQKLRTVIKKCSKEKQWIFAKYLLILALVLNNE